MKNGAETRLETLSVTCQRSGVSAHPVSARACPQHLLTNSNNQRKNTKALIHSFLFEQTIVKLTARKRAFRCDGWYLDKLDVTPCFVWTPVLRPVSLFALQSLMDVCWLEWGCFFLSQKRSAPTSETRPLVIMRGGQLHGVMQIQHSLLASVKWSVCLIMTLYLEWLRVKQYLNSQFLNICEINSEEKL